MTLKWIGAVLIMISCSGVGFSIAAAHRKAERSLQQLITTLEYMYHELQYRMTPLPQLICAAAEESSGVVRDFLLTFAGELQQQSAPDAGSCMALALKKTSQLPEQLVRNLKILGTGLGRFDLSGQLSGLESVKQLCCRDLDGLLHNRDVRIRSYQTLGICAGVALVILFI